MKEYLLSGTRAADQIKKAEFILMAVLSQIERNLPNDTTKIVGELVDHNETGVALDILCAQVLEYGIELSGEHKARLKDVAFLLDIPLSQLDGLSD